MTEPTAAPPALQWDAGAWRIMHHHCQLQKPREACGALVGWPGADGAWGRVERVHALTNVEEGTDHYCIDPDELLALFATYDNEEMEVLGWFHSHPRTSCQPSELDLEMALPGFIYVVVGVDGVHTFAM